LRAWDTLRPDRAAAAVGDQPGERTNLNC
jgi:hypothetical protein